jgi:predicted Rossmann-fold nucleotide-binding protein
MESKIISNDNKKTLRVLVGAEAFGFGPCSKLISIVKKLKADRRDIIIDFIGDGSSLNFALQNDSLFNNVWEYEGSYPNSKNYHYVLSVMNPYLALWGWFHKKQVIYIDSLYWFWSFEEDKFQHIENVLNELVNVRSHEEIWAITKNIRDHHLHYLAHKISNLSCAQLFIDNDDKTVDIYRDSISNVVSVSPIVDLSFKKSEARDTILISLGGLLSPFNQKKEALSYVELVLKLMAPFITEIGGRYKVVLTTNPEITKHIKNTPPGLVVTSMSHSECLQQINRSVLIFAPAGLTTIFECLLYETPIFILPELHDGHLPNYLGLGKGNSLENKREQIFPNALISFVMEFKGSKNNPDDEIRRIQSLIKKLNAVNDTTVLELQRKILKMISLLDKESDCRVLAKEQYDFVFSQSKSRKLDDVNTVINSFLTVEEKIPPILKRHTVGIISSAVHFENETKMQELELISTKLAENNVNISTGAAIGIPHLIGKKAKSIGSKLIGFSPSADMLTHSKIEDNAPADDFDLINFYKEGFTARSLDFVKTADAIIMIAGRMGTLSEFTIAFEEGVPIYILQGYGGISDKIDLIIDFARKDGPRKPFITNNTEELITRLISDLTRTYYL